MSQSYKNGTTNRLMDKQMDGQMGKAEFMGCKPFHELNKKVKYFINCLTLLSNMYDFYFIRNTSSQNQYSYK